jgi:FMN phosphatase YigB (HAD superfamily)
VHVAQSLFHDHVPAARHGIRSVWIDRRGDREGPGATASTSMPVRPIATFPSLATFADAFAADRTSRP